MSAAAATADAGAPKGKKKLLIVVIAAVVLLAAVGIGLLLVLKKNAAAEDAEADGSDHAEVTQARDPKSPPVFVPLEPFIVNLADKEAERYAQVGITLELADAAAEASIKVFMPAVRNNILMLLAHKNSAELLARDGKEQLAREVMHEAARGLGIVVAVEEEVDEEASGTKRKRKRRAPPELPITAVYFSNFIIQ